ncbi:11854_t:CDS:2, partial [Cetraspora pellucida]
VHVTSDLVLVFPTLEPEQKKSTNRIWMFIRKKQNISKRRRPNGTGGKRKFCMRYLPLPNKSLHTSMIFIILYNVN